VGRRCGKLPEVDEWVFFHLIGGVGGAGADGDDEGQGRDRERYSGLGGELHNVSPFEINWGFTCPSTVWAHG
jgi:hypothetical protein